MRTTEEEALLGQKPAEVFDSDWVDEYERKIELLHEELARFNSYLFVAERLAAFPWKLLVPIPEDRLVWNIFAAALAEGMILVAYRISIDSGSTVVTIPKLKNEVYEHLRSPEDKEAYAALLRARRFGVAVRAVQERIRLLRLTRVAHLLEGRTTAAPGEQDKLDIREFREYATALSEVFDLVSFGGGRAELPLPYFAAMHSDGEPRKTDVDRLLELIARSSLVLTMADREPAFWPIWKEQNLDAEGIAALNVWRSRLGLRPS